MTRRRWRGLLLAMTPATAYAAAPATRPAPPAPPPPAVQPAAAPPRGARRDPVLPPPLPIAPPTSQPTSRPATVAVAATGPVAVRPPAVVVAPPPPATQPAPPPPMATPATPIPDAVAYWSGYVAGRRVRERLAEDGSGYDPMAVVRGALDALADRDPAVGRDDVQAAFDQVEANVLQRRAEKRAADDPAFRRLADDNARRSAAAVAENGKRVGVRVQPDGAQVQVVTAGAGRPVAAARAVVARLAVSMADGTPIAATAADRPARLVLADALPALAGVVRQMRVGDRWQITLPADRAYGLAGSPPTIGPNQAVAYDVELVEVP